MVGTMNRMPTTIRIPNMFGIRAPTVSHDLNCFSSRRKIDKIILHEKFESEAFSWKGYDLALIHLSDNYGSDGNDTQTEQAIVPVCIVSTLFFFRALYKTYSGG